jgi:PAS domain-containing protein
MTGQRVEDALGAGWLKMLHPDDVQRMIDGIRIAIKTGQLADIEFRVRGVGGNWIRSRARGAPRYGPSGKVLCFYGVTEAMQDSASECEDMKAALAKLKYALDALPFGVMIADAQRCTINTMNHAAKQIYGDAFTLGMTLSEYTCAKLIRRDGTPLKPDDYPLARAILRSEPVDNEYLIFERQGAPPIHLAISSRPIYDDGQLIGGISIICAIQLDRTNERIKAGFTG